MVPSRLQRGGLVESVRLKKAKMIRYFLMDVDGVMTDGTISLNENGEETQKFSIYDGQGVSLLHAANIGVGILSGRKIPCVIRRADDLKIRDLSLGVTDKLASYHEMAQRHGLRDEEVAYMGDDLPDLPVLMAVGFSIAPGNAVTAVLKKVDWVTKRCGGAGAVREAIDFILAAKGL